MAFLFAAPSSPPTKISITEVTYSRVTVQWGPVDCVHRNGDITGYSLRYGVKGSSNTQTVNVSGDYTTENTIHGLVYATIYSIEVAAVNSAGIGVFSASIIFATEGK